MVSSYTFASVWPHHSRQGIKTRVTSVYGLKVWRSTTELLSQSMMVSFYIHGLDFYCTVLISCIFSSVHYVTHVGQCQCNSCSHQLLCVFSEFHLHSISSSTLFCIFRFPAFCQAVHQLACIFFFFFLSSFQSVHRLLCCRGGGVSSFHLNRYINSCLFSGFHHHSFNQYISDKLSYIRPIPDSRNQL